MASKKLKKPSGGIVNRRDFLVAGGAGIACLAAVGSEPRTVQAAESPAQAPAYPATLVAPLADIAPGAEISFSYPDDDSPAVLLRLAEPAQAGVGPNQEIVAFSLLCTHKGCPVTYSAERKMLICPCHWSSFDPVKGGQMIIGQASQDLPQIRLQIVDGMVKAVGVDGLIYGRHTNIL